MEAPLLAIVGTEDFMTVEDIQQTVEACKNPDSRMYVIQGGDHTFRTLTRDTRVFYQAAQATLMWLKETL
jgi:alpha/beta superfamily hydrolase